MRRRGGDEEDELQARQQEKQKDHRRGRACNCRKGSCGSGGARKMTRAVRGMAVARACVAARGIWSRIAIRQQRQTSRGAETQEWHGIYRQRQAVRVPQVCDSAELSGARRRGGRRQKVQEKWCRVQYQCMCRNWNTVVCGQAGGCMGQGSVQWCRQRTARIDRCRCAVSLWSVYQAGPVQCGRQCSAVCENSACGEVHMVRCRTEAAGVQAQATHGWYAGQENGHPT